MNQRCCQITIGFVLLSASLYAQQGIHPVISEIRYDERSGINEEFVELYNPTPDTIFLGGWALSYKSKTGTSWRNKETFGPEHHILPCGFFLWGGDAVEPLPDVVETNQNSIGLSNSGGHIVLLNAEKDSIDRVAWEGGDSPEGNEDAGKTEDGGSLERKASAESTPESMAGVGEEAFSGNAQDTDNNGADFVSQPPEHVNPQNSKSSPEPDPEKIFGKGNARFSKDWAFGNTVVDIRLQIRSEPGSVIQQAGVLPPWDAEDVTLEEDSFTDAAFSFSGDTLLVSGVLLSGDQILSLVFYSAQLPGTPSVTAWPVFTETETSHGLLPVRSFPVFQVLPACIPISSLHKNGSDGIPLMLGDTVAVQGVVTAGTGTFSSEFTDVFIQDKSGGIKIFDNEITVPFSLGDSITVFGRLDQFHGMTELVPVWKHVIIHSADHALPGPVVLTCREISRTFRPDYGEPDEARLIRLTNVIYDPGKATLTDTSGSCGIYLSPEAGLHITPGKYHITGLLSQYTTDAQPPYADGYSIQPRFQSDVEPAAAIMFVTVPEVSVWHSDGVTLSFETSQACDVIVDYGSSETYTNQVQVSADSAHHQVRLAGLQAASIYHYRVVCRSGGDQIQTPDALFVTLAPADVAGGIHIYFNGPVHAAALQSVPASGNENLYDRLVERIQAARHSIDACFMKLTDPDVRDALIEARDQGLSVRFICEQDQSACEAVQSLIDAGIPVITDTFGGNPGTGCMHHKFAVFDRRDDSSLSDDWIWTGSFNLTDYGSYPQPYENALAIQDAALAAVYTDGFNRMWGSDSETPDAQAAGFEAGCFQNMPHQVKVGETLAEVYFSPEGGGMEAICNVIATADHTIDFCLFSFTRNYIAEALIQSHETGGVTVRGLMDSGQIESDAAYSQWAVLSAAFGERICKHEASKMLHHKYAVIDGRAPDSDPVVITGSYNWTHSAEIRNNENVLILHSADAADQYIQEFEARYHNASGINQKQTFPLNWKLRQNYPNPFNSATTIDFTVPRPSRVRIHVFDIHGRTVRHLENHCYSPGHYSVQWEARNDDGIPVPSGVYLIGLKAGDFTDQVKTVLLQ
ncbi:lamin tail domain-containing protein [bacterium]|nr:lamin tail domain-containing protein [bacterium]